MLVNLIQTKSKFGQTIETKVVETYYFDSINLNKSTIEAIAEEMSCKLLDFYSDAYENYNKYHELKNDGKSINYHTDIVDNTDFAVYRRGKQLANHYKDKIDGVKKIQKLVNRRYKIKD